jgi:predicted DNA binding protein
VIDIAMEMEQHDCPFIDTTLENEVSFSAVQWEFDGTNRELETRMVVDGAGRDALDNGLCRLRDHPNMHSYQLQKRWDETAQIRTKINETDAMARIRANDGFITGPFYIEDGSELWNVGFDSEAVADETLSELDRNNEFVVMSREAVERPLGRETVETLNAGIQLVEQCKQLTAVERETLKTAVQEGYFESPRKTTLGGLADEFDVSKPAVSNNLRRGQRKILQTAVGAFDILEK